MSIRIVLLRHAKSVSQGYAEDSLRPLSEEGKKKEQTLVEKLKQKGIVPTHILSSPFVRAVETAEILARGFEIDFTEEHALGDSYDSRALLSKLPLNHPQSTIFLVGHAPTLEHFITVLTGVSPIPEGISKSSAAVIEYSGEFVPGKGKLIHYLKA